MPSTQTDNSHQVQASAQEADGRVFSAEPPSVAEDDCEIFPEARQSLQVIRGGAAGTARGSSRHAFAGVNEYIRRPQAEGILSLVPPPGPRGPNPAA